MAIPKWGLLALLPLLLLCLAFDPGSVRPRRSDRDLQLGRLLKTEANLTSAGAVKAGQIPSDAARESTFGADPYRIRHLARTDQYLILLRNASKIVLCDRHLKIIDSAPGPRHPVAMDLVDDNLLLVGGELSGAIHRYRIGSKGIDALTDIELQDVVSVRDLVYDADSASLFLIDDFSRRLVQAGLPLSEIRQPSVRVGKQRHFPIDPGPLRILHVKNHLIIDFLLTHTLQIIPLRCGVPAFNRATRIVNKGPFWSVSALRMDDKLLIAAGGIENRPFSRKKGEFGYIDSFLYLFTLNRDRDGVFRWDANNRNDKRRYQSVNLSERGVLTPKALVFSRADQAEPRLWVTGYGSDRAVAYRLGAHGITLERRIRVMPGISDAVLVPNPNGASLVYTTPLLDRVIQRDLSKRGKATAPVRRFLDFPMRFTFTRLGEILFFTDLMTPNNSSRGELSRFTCEACHFEGRFDGRVHFTGRDHIHTATKPVRGLADNIPIFSRAGDRSLSSMVMTEFQVANQFRKGTFTIRKDRYPWMSFVENWPAELTPLALRQGLLSFFVKFGHEPNPWRIRHPTLSKRARQGLSVFRDRCADCHQPLRSTRTGEGVDFDHWSHWLTHENLDLIWGAPFLVRTGVKPYVDPAGARVPSLRRVWTKYPLFTNGSAQTIRDVLEDFRYMGSTVWHHFDTDGLPPESTAKALTPGEVADLEALLRYF
jgi:hypothetical protein